MGVGAAFALNLVPAITEAQVADTAVITGAGNFSLAANSSNVMNTSVQAGASGGKVGVAPPWRLSLPTNTTVASLGTTQQYHAHGGSLVVSGNFTASATHVGVTNTTASGIAAGGKAPSAPPSR